MKMIRWDVLRHVLVRTCDVYASAGLMDEAWVVAGLKAGLEAREDEILMDVPDWIPIKEQLPPKDKYVLAANGHGYVNRMALRYRDEVNDRWTWVGDGHIWHYNDVTHWMPMPSAPGKGV